MPIYHAKDNSFKQILGNNQLFAEFLRDFIPIDILKNVAPEDIEDVKERYTPLFQESRESDTVKRIRLKNQSPLFVIAIVEHESGVNFRSSFKMLQYITLVLDVYEKEVNQADPGASLRKDFKYPPVLPIVFHDGAGPWTAEKNFLNRTALSDVFEKYIPKFEYELVSLYQYSPEELTRFNDVLSLILLIDHIGTLEGKNLLKALPRDYLEQIALKIPENLNKLLTDVVTTLLDRFGAEKDDIAEITGYIEKKEITTMFDAVVERYWKLKDEGYNQAKSEDQEQNRRLEEENRRLEEKNQRFEEEIRQFEEKNQQFEEKNRRFEEKNRQFEEENRRLREQLAGKGSGDGDRGHV
jgi:hypothetical protein